MKQGFFDLGSGQDHSQKQKTKRKVGCNACGLYKRSNNSRVPLVGKGKYSILFIGDNPNDYNEQYFRKALRRIGYNVEDCYYVNAIRCKGKYTDAQIGICREKLLENIEEIQPKIIIPLGITAIKSVIGHKISGRIKGLKYWNYFSEQIFMHDKKYWVCPTFDIYQVLDNLEKNSIYEKMFLYDMKKAFSLLNKDFPKEIDTENIEIIYDIKKVIECIDYFINSGNPVSFDYETTGLKPHKNEHEIKTMSLSNVTRTVAFPMFGDKEFIEKVKEFLISNVEKISHKFDFEDSWSFQKLGVFIKNWHWDTNLAAHCLHNKKSTSLKFQAFVKLGVLGYDSDIDQYLISDKKLGCNAINKIEQAPLEKLLYYNALDSLYTYYLYLYQKKEMKSEYKKGFDFFMEGAQALSHIQVNGICIDKEALEKNEKILTRRIEHYHKKIMSADEVKLWKNKDKFNVDSHTQLAKLLYDILKYEKPDNGKLTDVEQLENINTTFTHNIISYRKLLKMRDTYLGQMKRECVNGKVYPFFSLHIPKTFRSSSDSPNFQNMPKREPAAKKWVRSLVQPSLGRKLVEYDFKGMEVCVSACVHKDRNMIEYIKNPKNDMHRDTAANIFKMEKEEITKDMRFIAKNSYVFATFYGSTSYNTAPNIWKEIKDDENIMSHMKKMRIGTMDKFQKHMDKVDEIFWGERFPDYAKWKKYVWQEYLKNGYADLITGFKAWGPMSFNELTNIYIQGPAFHILLWSLTQIQQWLEIEKWQSKIIGQIHDAIVVDMVPWEEKNFDDLVKYWGTQAVVDEWKWINVPLVIEKEVGNIDENWTKLKEDKHF
jgi:uracil-DNA glycosylase family 4